MKTIDHIALLVDDLEIAQAWYEENLDAICEFSDSFYRRMRFNNSTVALISKHPYYYNHIVFLPGGGGFSPKGGGGVGREGEMGGRILIRMEIALCTFGTMIDARRESK